MKATVGAHEVISTIMLNWIAIYGAQYLFELERPAPGSRPTSRSPPRSSRLGPAAGVWGALQPLHAGIFLALGRARRLLVLINRTTLGYEVRAVGHNPDAARYGGIPVARSYIAAMAICGAFAGLAGACDVLGLGVPHRHQRHRRSARSASSASRSRCSGATRRSGIAFAALLFGGAPGRHVVAAPRPERLPAELAGNLAMIIQGLIILFVGAAAPAGVRMARAQAPAGASRRRRTSRGADLGVSGARPHPARRPRRRDPGASSLGLIGARLALPPLQCRRQRCRSCSAWPRWRVALWALDSRRARARRLGALRRGRGDGVRDLGAGHEHGVDRAGRQRGLFVAMLATPRRSPSPPSAASSRSAPASSTSASRA